MGKHRLGDTVALESGLLFGERRRREGTVTAVADDGMVTAQFPQPPYSPMTVTSDAEHFVTVRTARSEVLEASAALGRMAVECDRLRTQLGSATHDVDDLGARLKAASTALNELRTTVSEYADAQDVAGDAPWIGNDLRQILDRPAEA